MDEYISGNYAFDKEDGLRLDILEKGADGVKLEFLAIPGRTYTVQQSNDLSQWQQVDFITQEVPETTKASFLAKQVTKVNVTVSPSGNSGNAKFFKLMVQ